jgi:formamidopyrimidine-DNA glycosylase
MPELPEVETILRGLERCVLGRRITKTEVLTPWVISGFPDVFCRQVQDRTIVGFARKGKSLAVRLSTDGDSPPAYLLVRLGMTGQIVVAPRDGPLLPHTHVRMALDIGPQELRYRDSRRFGRLRFCTLEELELIFGSLGPDALTITETQLLRAVHGRQGSIKGLLLNQAIISGLGNIYADEALFRARIHPETAAGRLSKSRVQGLYRAIHKVLRRAIALQGTSFRDYIDIEGRPGSFRPRLCVYQRTGKPCPRCATSIRRIRICGRSSHFCPNCQRRSRALGRSRRLA